ncbi:MAG: twitch domain-containing radical SAM protein [Bdellovibrionota bacterium]
MSDDNSDIKALQKMQSSLCLHQWDFPCVNLSSGRVRACCRVYPRPLAEESLVNLGKEAIFNDQYNQDRRLDMLEGRRHEECNSCWSLEEKGAPSPRLGLPVFMEKMQKRLKVTQDELVKMITNPGAHPEILKAHHPFELEISFGNKCDLACVYCSYIYSSRIALEQIEAGLLDKDTYEREMKPDTSNFQSVFWEWFGDVGIQTLEVVNIIGGEPLINDLFYENVDKLLHICETTTHVREKKILLQIITNLNAPPHYLKKFISKLPELSRHFDISLLASMEATGTRAEYIRKGLSWDRFVSNFEEVLTTSRDHLFQFGFLSSINVLSVTSLENFVRFAVDLSKKHSWPVYLGYNQVMHPTVMSVLNLSSDFTQYISRAIDILDAETEMPPSWNDYRQSLIQLEETFKSLKADERNTQSLRYWIKSNDQRRKTVFLDVFPEMKDFIS